MGGSWARKEEINKKNHTGNGKARERSRETKESREAGEPWEKMVPALSDEMA